MRSPARQPVLSAAVALFPADGVRSSATRTLSPRLWLSPFSSCAISLQQIALRMQQVAIAPSPVTASIRRTPAAVPDSEMMRNRPISPVRDVREYRRTARWRNRPCSARERDRHTSRQTAPSRLIHLRSVKIHDVGFDRQVAADLRVHQVFHRTDLFRLHRFKMREVEAQRFVVDQRAFLRNVTYREPGAAPRASGASRSGSDGYAARRASINIGLHGVADFQRTAQSVYQCDQLPGRISAYR